MGTDIALNCWGPDPPWKGEILGRKSDPYKV